MMIYRRLLGMAMLGIGLAITVGGSTAFSYFMHTFNIEAHTDAFGIALALCGLFIAVDPRAYLFPVLNIPYFVYVGSLVYYALTNNIGSLAGLIVNITLYGMAMVEIVKARRHD